MEVLNDPSEFRRWCLTNHSMVKLNYDGDVGPNQWKPILWSLDCFFFVNVRNLRLLATTQMSNRVTNQPEIGISSKWAPRGMGMRVMRLYDMNLEKLLPTCWLSQFSNAAIKELLPTSSLI